MIHILKRKSVKLVTMLVVMIVVVSSFSCVALASGKKGIVTASLLNVRTQPNTYCSIAGQYPYGSVVDVVGYEGNWYKVKYNGVDAYISADYVRLVDASEVSRSSANATSGQRVIDIAKNYIGTPYRYGGMSPAGFDCSGFVKYCYAQMGVNLNRTAASQTAHGVYVAKENLMPGDLVFFASNGSYVHHVGMYVGNGMMIHSPSTGKNVEIVSIMSGYYARTYYTARRIFN